MMANLVKRTGELSKKIRLFAKYKVIPTSKMIGRRIGPPVVNTSKYLIKTLGPPLRQSSRYLVNAAKPHIQRSTSAVAVRVKPHVDRGQEIMTRTLASVIPSTVKQTKKAEGLIEGPEENPVDDDDYRERYIPVTRRSVIRQIMQKEDFLTEEEMKHFEDFALALDSAIVNKYHGILQELKNLFDPINPDKDTVVTRKWNPRERQDNEFWLLQRLDDIMEKANFHELPQSVVDKCLEEHKVGDGVMVSVDPSKYDVLKFWALGKERIPVTVPWYRAMFMKKENLPKPNMYYKRVVVAIRLKRDQKLLLKSFKEIPVNALEMMLPEGKIKIDKFDKGIIGVSLTLATIGVLAKVVTVLAAMNFDWTLIASGVFGLTALRGWTMYKNKRNHYLVDLSRLLYFKNVANNRGLLALLVDRAEDESFKEALLVYTFLLANRPRSLLESRSVEMSPDSLGGITSLQLEENIMKWVYQVSGTQIEFESCEAVHLLKKFGILSELDNRLHVLPLKAALRNLPQTPQTLVARAEEVDLEEGYDRDVFVETEEHYQKEEKVLKRVGWH